MALRKRTRRFGRWPMALVSVVVAAGGLIGASAPAHAQFLYQSTRYQSAGAGINDWAQYDANGYPIARDPNCSQYAGVRANSKVWASAYGLDEPLHTNFRMQFHTTYSPAVAVAKLGYKNAGVNANCTTLNYFWGLGETTARIYSSCYGANAPTRWCDLAVHHPNDPAVDPHLGDRCPGTAVNGLFWPTAWHEWHNLPDRVGNEAQLYNIDVLAQFASWLKSLGLSIKMPVYLDDVTIVGGVSNFDQASGQPTYGNAWYGYGRVASPSAMNLLTLWYDQAARALGYDPVANPATAHQAVDNAIAAGQHPQAQIWFWKGTRGDLYNQFMCTDTYSPKVRDVVDPGGGVSMTAIGQDLSGWVQAETGMTLCQAIHKQPQFASIAGVACNNTFVGAFFMVVDNNQGMNQTQVTCPDGVTYPPNGIAQILKVNLGCNRDIHLARLFSQMKAFLGG